MESLETPIVIALIGAGTTVTLSLITLVQQLLMKDHVKEVKGHVQEIKFEVSKTKDEMLLLEKNTNSIKDALVKVTAESNLAKGIIQGVFEEKAREQAKKELNES